MNGEETEDNLNERRMSTRFRIQAPAVAMVGQNELWAFTREISTRAVYLQTTGEEETPAVGDILEFVIKIPPSLSYSKTSFIKGRGRTIRVDDLGSHESGLAVEILEYGIGSESSLRNPREGETGA